MRLGRAPKQHRGRREGVLELPRNFASCRTNGRGSAMRQLRSIELSLYGRHSNARRARRQQGARTPGGREKLIGAGVFNLSH